MHACRVNLQEIGGADNAEDDANGKWELCSTRVMNDSGRRKLIASAASFQPAATGGQYVFHPLGFLAVGEGDHEAIRRSKNVYWRSVEPPRRAAHMGDEAESRQAVGKGAGYAVRNCLVEGCYPSFAKANEKNGKQNYRNHDEGYCDRHAGSFYRQPFTRG